MANPYQDGQQYGQEQDGAQQQAAAPAAGGKKKRAYAGQAFDFGSGANAGLAAAAPPGGQPPAAAAGAFGYPGQQAQPAYGMPQQPAYGQPGYVDPAAAQQQPAYGQPAAYGQPGYDPAHPGYPQQSTPVQPGVQGVTQQFAQMGMGGQPPQQPQSSVPQAAQRLNPLIPTDISMQGQPFHVSDLDQPPPPIILPPNVCILRDLPSRVTANDRIELRHSLTSLKLPA
jgi:protein transport protein SEC24